MSPTFPTFDLAEIAEEAAERAGIEFRAGYALRSARRSLELLSIEWGNRGLNLWTVKDLPIILTPGNEVYPLPDDTIDVIDHYLRYYQGGVPHDYPLARYSLAEYNAIPTKESPGRPTIIHVRREITPRIFVWQVPDHDGWIVNCQILRRMASVGKGGAGEPDLPFRFIPAIIAGLAYQMALKSKDPAIAARVQGLKSDYEEQFMLASDEDRDRASVRWVPWGYSPL